MNCPECDHEMESQEASALSEAPGESKVIASNYWCQWCQSYWRWDLGRGIKRMDSGPSITAHLVSEALKEIEDGHG